MPLRRSRWRGNRSPTDGARLLADRRRPLPIVRPCDAVVPGRPRDVLGNAAPPPPLPPTQTGGPSRAHTAAAVVVCGRVMDHYMTFIEHVCLLAGKCGTGGRGRGFRAQSVTRGACLRPKPEPGVCLSRTPPKSQRTSGSSGCSGMGPARPRPRWDCRPPTRLCPRQPGRPLTPPQPLRPRPPGPLVGGCHGALLPPKPPLPGIRHHRAPANLRRPTCRARL